MKYLLIILSCLCFSLSLAQANEIHEERIQFEAGKSGATINGQIKGYKIVDYLLHAEAGQTISVKFAANFTSAYFNLLPPENPIALFTGSIAGHSYNGVLPLTGVYKIRVYLMRNAARRGSTAKYKLTLKIEGN